MKKLIFTVLFSLLPFFSVFSLDITISGPQIVPLPPGHYYIVGTSFSSTGYTAQIGGTACFAVGSTYFGPAEGPHDGVSGAVWSGSWYPLGGVAEFDHSEGSLYSYGWWDNPSWSYRVMSELPPEYKCPNLLDCSVCTVAGCGRCLMHDWHYHDCPNSPDCSICTVEGCGKCLTHDPHNHDPDPNTICKAEGGTNPACVYPCPNCGALVCMVHDEHDPNNICVRQGGCSTDCSICTIEEDGVACGRCSYHDPHSHDQDPDPPPPGCPNGPDCSRCGYMLPDTGKMCMRCNVHDQHSHDEDPDADPNNDDQSGLGSFNEVRLPHNLSLLWSKLTESLFNSLNTFQNAAGSETSPPKFNFVLSSPFPNFTGDFNFSFDFATLPGWADTLRIAARSILAVICTWAFIFSLFKLFRDCGN